MVPVTSARAMVLVMDAEIEAAAIADASIPEIPRLDLSAAPPAASVASHEWPVYSNIGYSDGSRRLNRRRVLRQRGLIVDDGRGQYRNRQASDCHCTYCLHPYHVSYTQSTQGLGAITCNGSCRFVR